MNINENSLVKPPELTSTQRQVSEALKSKQTEQYPLDNWYLGAIYAVNNRYNPDRFSQAAQSLRELLEKIPRIILESNIPRSYDFKGERRRLHNRFIKDEKRYHKVWKNKRIDSKLDKTLHRIGNYLKLNQTPTRREQIHSTIIQLDPMVDVFDLNMQEEKSGKFHQLWKEIENFAHHQCNPDEQHFMECFSSIDRIIIELFAPITARDHSEIKTILEKPELTEPDIKSMKALITRRGANYAFFFKNANAAWIPILKDWGIFKNPPNVQAAGDGRVSYPLWWPILYIQRVASSAPEQGINILVNLPETNNPRILREICEIAYQLEDINLSMKLNPWIIRYVKSPYRWVASRSIANLLRQWGTESEDSRAIALELLKTVISFKEDPMSEEKKDRQLRSSAKWTTALKPQPRFERWEYQQILEKGVNPIAEKDPFSVACILIEAYANMINLRMHQDVLDKNSDEDYSETWCRRLDKSDDGNYQNSEETLVYALTFACKKIYEQSPEFIGDLDRVLRSQRWKVFKRLRQYLYALNPNEQTLSWIRESIFKHKDYANQEYNYEFQLMIRKACEHFGTRLFNEEEQTRIFDIILGGPSKKDFRERLGDEFTEEEFQKRQHYFHKKQLRPFVQVLTGQYQHCYQKLKTVLEEIPLTDEDYFPTRAGVSGMISSRSPRSSEDLAKLKDDELLAYINEWSEKRWGDSDGLVEINIEALADAFQGVFRDSIIPNKKRLRFWIDRRDQVERPIYVQAIIQAIQEHVVEPNFQRLEVWLDFCDWVLLHHDVESENDVQQSDESRKHPSWKNSRRAVCDFLGKCLKKEVNIPFVAREQLAKLLRLLCTQFDRQLDQNQPILLSRDDQIMEAINSTRGRALENLVYFGYWVRRYDSNDSVPEVASILEDRFKIDAERPLTMPEHALLGLHYLRLCGLNKTWSIKHKDDFFPQEDIPTWLEAFGNFLLFNRPSQLAFEILKEDFILALGHLTDLKTLKNTTGEECVDTLGQYLFIYYLWGDYPLKGESGLLETFYNKTTHDRQYWANLFNHIGRILDNSGEHLEESMIKRIVAFFDWRFAEQESKELSEFTFWLEAKSLPSNWRLENYSKILDISQSEDSHVPIDIDALSELLANNLEKVVECFLKITDAINGNSNIYIQTDKAKHIIEAGLNSDNEEVRKNAKRAQENLLSRGDSDLSD